MNWRTLVLWATALMIVTWTGLLVVGNERLLAEGRPVFVRLAPVDPRSLIQGDYMALRYDISLQGQPNWPQRGTLLATVDQRGVVQSIRLYDEQATPRPNEQLLGYHRRGDLVLIGPESFFFQEGTAELYQEARYGELRAAPDGTSLLVGLRDEALRPLGPPMP